MATRRDILKCAAAGAAVTAIPATGSRARRPLDPQEPFEGITTRVVDYVPSSRDLHLNVNGPPVYVLADEVERGLRLHIHGWERNPCVVFEAGPERLRGKSGFARIDCGRNRGGFPVWVSIRPTDE